MQNISISRGHVLREWLPLVALAFSTFIFNTSEFIPIGLLSDIAADFAITESKAGVLITVYAWVVAIASLPLMLMVSGVESKRLMLGIFGLFVISHVGSALSTGYYMLMLSRIGVACSHAIFWSIVTPLAVRIAPKGKGSIALSIIVAGSSIAMIAGLPLGRAIGLAAGWRMTFLLIGCVAFAVMLFIAVVLPRTQGEKAFSLKQLPGLLKTPSLPGIYLVTVLSVTAHFTGYSYIEPFLQQVAQMPDALITAALTVFGVAGLAGSWLFARLFDGHRRTFLSATMVGISAALFMLLPLAGWVAGPLVTCVVWGVSATAFNVAAQAEVIRVTSEETSAVAMSIFSGLFNVGIGIGSIVGGIVCDGPGVGLVGAVGGIIAAVGALYCVARLGGLLERPGRAA